MKRILVVAGTRPEIVKLFPIIHALREADGSDVKLCVTGQHRDMAEPVLALAGLKPDHDLEAMQPGRPLNALLARLLDAIDPVLVVERPQIVVVQGDTMSAAAATLAAHNRGLPVAHVEAGLRSGDWQQPWPEEGCRKMVGALASLHFAPTEGARQALRMEGVGDATIHVTGNTVIDALLWVLARIDADPVLAAKADTVLASLTGRKLLLVTAHRRESFGDGMEGIAVALHRLAQRDDVAIVFPRHLNPDARAPMDRIEGLANVVLADPLDYPNFARLLGGAHVVLTDSGGLQEEAPALGKPVLVLRDVTERPEGVAAGTARLVGTDPDRIVAAATELLDHPAAYAAMARAHSPYGDGKAAGRIAAILSKS